MLAQSTFRRFYLIGRTLDRAGKLGNPVPARRGKTESKAYRQEAGMQREIHGGNVYGREVRLDFSVNINPLGMPQGVRQAITEYTAWDETYPDIEFAQGDSTKRRDCAGADSLWKRSIGTADGSCACRRTGKMCHSGTVIFRI